MVLEREPDEVLAAACAAVSAPQKNRRYDSAARRRSTRVGRQRGCVIYIAQEELAKTGIPLDGPPPAYRVWGAARGRVVVQLYREA